MTGERVFTPVAIGTMSLKNRIVMAPTIHEICYGGHPSEPYIATLATYARSGASMVCVGATNIDPDSPGFMFANGLSIAGNQYMFGARRLADAININGAKSCLQIFHPGRGAAMYWAQSDPGFVPWGASSKVPFLLAPRWEVARKGGRWRAAMTMNPVPVREITPDEIARVVELHALAALRAKAAGFDAVNLHFANVTLVMDFISPHTNARVDAYGGDWENRMRLPCEIIEAVKAAVGKDFPVIPRIPADQGIGEMGIRIEDVVKHIVPRLEEAGADAIDLSAGMLDHTPHRTIPPMYSPRGGMLPYGEAVKKVTKLPVIVAGRLCDPRLIVKAVESGRCDIAALCRPLMADPLIPRKTIDGTPDDVRMCVACGYCATERGATFYCAINPEQGRELTIPAVEPAAAPRKVLVAGGGPAGMEAARILRQRGHDVTLIEASDQLGGSLRAASAMPLTREWRTFTRWHSRQLEKVGVRVVLNTRVTRALVEKMSPDAVVVATGASRATDIKGADRPNVVSDADVLLKGIETGKAVVVLGGAFWDVEVAMTLADQGKDVTLVRELETISIMELGITRAMPILTGMLQQRKIRPMFSARVRDIGEKGVTIVDPDGNASLVAADTVVLSRAGVPDRTLAGELQGLVGDVYEVGDCEGAGGVAAAVLAGRVVGARL